MNSIETCCTISRTRLLHLVVCIEENLFLNKLAGGGDIGLSLGVLQLSDERVKVLEVPAYSRCARGDTIDLLVLLADRSNDLLPQRMLLFEPMFRVQSRLLRSDVTKVYPLLVYVVATTVEHAAAEGLE